MEDSDKLIVNPYVILREEFDDWAVLFNPDTGHGFGLSPTGVYLWKLLDGEHSSDDLLEELRDHADAVPEDAREHIGVFVDALVAEGLAALGDSESYREKSSHTPLAAVNEVKPFTYDPPTLVDFTAGRQARGTTCSGHGSHGGSCGSGAGATTCCYSGTCGTPPANCTCYGGGCGYYDNGTGCDCNGACVDSYGCNYGSDAGTFCYTGGCAYYHICNTGSGLSCSGGAGQSG
jgi:SynChlorMet cassette protein ScmD